jgi:hypothetical protein
LINKKRANVNVNDEESGKDGGTEVADQIKSSCNLNDDGGKNNQGKKVQLREVVRRILVLKLKIAKETLMEFMNAQIEIMLLEKIVKNPVPMKIIIMVGTVMRLIKELTVTRGVKRRLVVLKDKNMMSQLKKKEQRMMEMMKNQGIMVELREPIK